MSHDGGRPMKPRKFDPKMKVAAVLEVLKGESRVSDVCRKYQISETLFYNWRDKFLEGGKRGLTNGKGEEDALRMRISELERIIGKQAVQIEILKKIQM